MLIRYQDKDGRGPFRPGVPALWADLEGESPPSVFARFPKLAETIGALHDGGWHVGCCCVGWSGLHRYFTATERKMLHEIGYRLHRAPNSSAIFVDDLEAVIAVRKPLKTLPRVRHPWALGGNP